MKALSLSLFFFLFFCCISATKAQYQSLFGQNSTEWVFEWGNLDVGEQDTIYTVQDTFFYGKWWKEIACTPTWGVMWYPGGFLSEDTITGKVWYKSKSDFAFPGIDTSVQLAFDFSLQVGDTFDITNVWGPVPDSLWIVDSVYYEDGKKHIQFKAYIVSGERFTLIEGVGCNLGIIYKQFNGYMQSHYLLCAYQDTIQTYMNKYYGYCNVLSNPGSSISLENAAIIKIYPNPIQHYLYIEEQEIIEIDRIQIYNSLGQKILEMPYARSIDLSELHKGIYNLLLLNKQSIIFKQSIIKL